MMDGMGGMMQGMGLIWLLIPARNPITSNRHQKLVMPA
jgi:hypothetical protein